MRKFVCAAVVTFIAVGFAVADYNGAVTSVDGSNIKGKKGVKGKLEDEAAVKVAKDFKGIFQGKVTVDPASKKKTYDVVGDKALSKEDVAKAIKDGGDKGANARFITNKDDEVVQILFVPAKGK